MLLITSFDYFFVLFLRSTWKGLQMGRWGVTIIDSLPLRKQTDKVYVS